MLKGNFSLPALVQACLFLCCFLVLLLHFQMGALGFPGPRAVSWLLSFLTFCICFMSLTAFDLSLASLFSYSSLEAEAAQLRFASPRTLDVSRVDVYVGAGALDSP